MLTKRILALLAAGVMACTVLAGCTSAPQNGTESSSQTAQTEAYYTFTDALGKEVVLEAQPERVAVLMGSMRRPGLWQAVCRWASPMTISPSGVWRSARTPR